MTRPAWLPPWPDLLMAGFFMALTTAEGILNQSVVELVWTTRVESSLLYVGIALPAMAALAWRRAFPITVAIVVMLGNFMLNVDGKTSTILAVFVASYSVGAYSSRAVLGLGVLLCQFLLPWVATGTMVPSDAAAALVFLGLPWALGRIVASRLGAADAAVERATLLERERVALDAAAAAEERVRLARELHDVVSHSISVIAVQSQAIRRRLGPEHAREAEDLRAVEETAREAMAELRRLFGVLRSERSGPESLAPQPGLDDLDRLIDQVRMTGLDVRLERDGDQAPLQAGVGLAAYRIVQEALTNVIRHADARQVAVLVRQRPEALDITVDDDGRGLSFHNGGHGLVGIRERAELYGGSLRVETSPAGGVRVSAHLPLSRVPA